MEGKSSSDQPGWRVSAWGVDTVSYAWRPSPAVLSTFFDLPSLRRGERGSYWLKPRINGCRLGGFVGADVLVCESRLAAVLSGETSDRRLVPPAKLEEGAEKATAAWREVGIELGDTEVRLRRCDPASEIRFTDPDRGISFLWALAEGLRVPRYKLSTILSEDGTRPETIYWLTAKRGEKRGRIYDAGVRHRSDEPGRRIRYERQIRWTGKQQPLPSSVAAGDLRKLLLGPLLSAVDNARAIQVMRPTDAIHEILDLRDAGEFSSAKAERLIGTLTVLALNQQDRVWDRRTLRERLKELEKLELSPGGPALYDDFDLAPVLRALADEWG